MTTYTVVAGDTMWRIAVKHGIGLSELLKANPQISNSSFIVTGQKINIPSTSTSTYTVMSGDTLWSIATKKGIKLNDLMAANPQITNSALIVTGQKINIPSTSSVTDDIEALENEVICLVNVERAKVGLSALVKNEQLSHAARIKSEDFINNNYFAHTSPTYGTPFEMLKTLGITFTAAGENIASGQKTAADVMNSWMNSSGHRANILNSTYNQIGVGVAKENDGNTYWTQMFIRS